MRTHRLALATALLATTAAAQDGKTEKVEPVTLVERAASLVKEKKIEDAVLLSWRALDLLAAVPDGAKSEPAVAARALLQANDPCDAQRRAAFAAVGKHHVDLAAAYRGRKWFDTAAALLEVADRHDGDAAVKEWAALKNAQEKEGREKGPCPLLLRKSTRLVYGYWREAGECLEALQHSKREPPYEWITNTLHKDHALSVEFRPKAADQPHCAGLWVGYTGDGDACAGYRVVAYYEPATKEYRLSIMERRGAAWTDRGTMQIPAAPSPDGFHRLVVHVARERLRARLDDAPVLEHKAESEIRGDVGVSVGRSDVDSCGVFVRNLSIDPLPPERPVDDKTRTPDEAAELAATWAIDDAKDLLAKKHPEQASRRLREAQGKVAAMTAGEPRTKLSKSIDQLLAQADPLAPKAKKTAHAIATDLAKAADDYAKAGLPRAALHLVERAAAFDPDGQAAHLAAAREAAGK